MKKINLNSIALAVSLLICGCAEENLQSSADDKGQIPLSLHAEINQVNVTRANDTGFADGDKIGVYMVDFENGMPGELMSEGNRGDNVVYAYEEESSKWVSPTPILFKDSSTQADLYGYYPYKADIDNVEAVPISVVQNQSKDATDGNLSGYEASDLLWAKESGITSSSPHVILTFNHILAGIEVNLVEGDGFEKEEWNNLQKSVLITGTKRDATFNLMTGQVSAKDNFDNLSIIANPHKDVFRAVVIPQTVSAGANLMYVNVGADSYSFSRSDGMSYNAGKLHKFTFEVSKKKVDGDYEFALLDEAVTMWESDPTSHDGMSRAYQVVNVNRGERLSQVMASMNIIPSEVTNLKLTGTMDGGDFLYIRDNMRKIQALNLKDVRITYWMGDDFIPDMALTNSVTLKHIVLPDRLEIIGDFAFAGTILEGSLKIPEGVKRIGSHAFTNYWNESTMASVIPGGQLLANNNFTGILELPSTVEHIGTEAFRSCDFTGSLILPSSLKYLGRNVFSGCKNFSGEIHFPESLTEIEASEWSNFKDGEGVFYGMSGLVGNFVLPKNMKILNGFGGLDVSNILFPDGATEVGAYAFCNSKVKDGIVLPDNILEIGSHAFHGCNASYIRLPLNISRIKEGCFEYCRNLSDTLKIPEKVETIESSAFGHCSKLSALELPAQITHIGSRAFYECFSLEYIHCNAKEPPLVGDWAFYGVEKDNFTVEVPEGCVDAYRNAPGWCEFKRISEYKNFVARPSKYNVLNKGGKKEIILNADTDWELADCPSWCHIDKAFGSKKTVLNLTVDKMNQGSGNRSGKISFRLKGNSNYETHINVTQCDYEYEEDSYLQLQKATKGAGIDLFFCGDGYDAFDISTGLYLEDMRQEMEYFFAVEPYTTYRDYFNVYTAIALSEDSGVESLNHWRNTKFHTCAGDGISRISSDYTAALDYCAVTVPPISSKTNPKVGMVLVANTNIYDGITYVIGDTFCAVVTKSDSDYPYDARGLVQHEAGGHGIGWLGDEYRYHEAFIQKCQCTCCDHVAELQGDHAWGYSLNLSLTGKYKEVPWSHLIFNPAYGDIVDIYEGGYFHTRGVYRSEQNSCMNNNVPYFSTWSRQLIVQRIMKLAGETFSLDSFYAKDSREMGRDFTGTRSRSAEETQSSFRGQAPVFIKNYKFGKKGGRK